MIRTFIDSGVLIAAARGNSIVAEQALEILSNPDLEFVSSIFLKMEVLPKAIYHNQQVERDFYDDFFGSVVAWAAVTDQLIQEAYQEASQSGLGAMDAFHVVAALSLEADQLITSEKLTSSIHRTNRIKIISIHPS
jgi:predicted nucleic acid-binding protein